MSSVLEAPVAVKKNYLTGLKEALDEEMSANPDLVCLGEDIGILGGAFGVTEGLQAKYGKERVIDMPISESAIVGVSVGLALNGKRAMAEMQFIDFISCGFDQIVNNMATYHYRTAGEVSMPVVIRGPAGGYGGGALYHSQMNEAWFCHSPGLKVVCPSTPRDAKGLLKACLRNPDPVIFFEIKELYRNSHIAEELGDADEVIPLGQAVVRRQGEHVTLAAYGNPVHFCLQAAEKLAAEGISCEVIDLRTLVPLDEDTLFASVEKTGRFVAVNEAPMTCGFAGELVARVADRGFRYLDAPPVRVSRMDTPVPWATPLERFVLPSVDDIIDTVRRVVRF